MPNDSNHSLTGDIRYHKAFKSAFLEHPRDLVVYVPPGYDESAERRYPVLYLHDGQNVFDRATSFGEEWHVDETAQAMIEAGAIQPLIIVGIYNAGDHRVDEYTPTTDEKKGGGHADDYGRMMIDELKPFIDRTYRTRIAAESTGLGGSSLGGLLTLHLGLRHPSVFGRLAVVSPSAWWDDRVIIREVEQLPAKLPLRIWLDVGTNEGEEATRDVHALRDALLAKGWTAGQDLAYEEIPGGEHNEASWASRVGRILQYLFPHV